MPPWGRWLSLACLLTACVSQASPCDSAPQEKAHDQRQVWTQLTTSTVTLNYRLIPNTAAVGQSLGIELIACPQPGATAPDSVRVDARMPTHGHGMNYRPKGTRLAAGHYRFNGLILHMPGQWQLIFDVMQAGQRTQLTAELELTQ